MRLGLPLTILASLALFVLAACGGSDRSTSAEAPGTGDTPSPNASRATAPPSPTPTPEPTPTPSPAPTPSPTISPSPIPLAHPEPYIVAIDAGHGGPCNFGTAHFNELGQVDLSEKVVALEVALKLEMLLREAGYTVVLTRSGDYSASPCTGDRRYDVTTDIQERVDIANAAQADVLISIHFNGWVDGSQRGTEVYYNPDRPFGYYSYGLAFYIQQWMVYNMKVAGYMDVNDRGLKFDSEICCDPAVPNSWLLGANPDFRPSLMPGVISEVLFMTNDQDAEWLLKPEFRNAIAKGYKDALDAYFIWLRGVLAQPPAQ
jgi:N-acetylmuramoyl-L-alanine amidase